MQKKYKAGLLIATAVGLVAFITRDTPREKEQKYIRRGIEAFDKGEYNKARLNYKNAARLAPTDPEVAYRWALVDEAEGDIRNAFGNFLAAEQQSPHYAPALKKIAHYLVAGEQTGEAQKRVDTLLADNPSDAEAHALQAGLMLRAKDYAGTEKEARAALAIDPANITAFSVLTGLYMAQNDRKKAGEILEEGIRQNPKDVALLLLKAGIYENPFDAAKIKEAYDVIFALKPADPSYRLYLSQIYINAQLPDQAEGALRAGITAIPADWSLKRALFDFLAKFRSMEAAEKEMRRAMEQYPDNNDLYLWLSDLYVQHNEIDKAVALLEQIISRNGDDKQGLNARTSLARINFVKGNKDVAEKIVNAVLEKTPSNSDALLIRANMESDRGQYESAVIDLRAVIRDRPKSPEAYQLLAEVLLLQGYTDLAIETMNRLVDIDPGNAANRTRLAQMYSLNKDYKRAMEQLDIVAAASPQYPVAWETRARIAISNKDKAMAQEAIDKLDALVGQQATATFLKGQLAAGSDKGAESIEDYKKVIDADPSSPIAEHALYAMVGGIHSKDELEKTTAYIASLKTDSPYVATLLGECYAQLGKNDLAVAAFDKAIANHPVNQEPYLNRAKLLIADNKPDEALDMLKKASAALPLDVRAPLMRAGIYGQRKQYKEAVGVYEELLKANPSLVLAANNMASIIADQFYTDPDMLDKARDAIEKFAGSPEPSVQDTLGWVYYRQNKPDKAVAALARAAAADEKAPAEIHYHYGAALLKAGNRLQAKTELVRAVAGDARYPALDEAKKLLAGLN